MRRASHPFCNVPAQPSGDEDGALIVTDIEASLVGKLAASHRFELHELSPRRASLEAAFMELTEGSQEYPRSAARERCLTNSPPRTNRRTEMTSATIATATPLSKAQHPAPPDSSTPFHPVVELISLRSTHITVALGVLLSVATTALVAVAVGNAGGDWSKDFSPITTSMAGNIFSIIVFSVFGALASSREYSNGMIRLTLAATPNRGRVFFAKVLLVGTTMAVIGVLTTVAMFLVGQAVLGAYDRPTTSLAEAAAQRMVFGLGIGMAFFPLIGLALGVILRSSAGAITAVLALLWLPQIFGAIVPMWWQEHILCYLPSNGIDSLTVGHIEALASLLRTRHRCPRRRRLARRHHCPRLRRLPPTRCLNDTRHPTTTTAAATEMSRRWYVAVSSVERAVSRIEAFVVVRQVFVGNTNGGSCADRTRREVSRKDASPYQYVESARIAAKPTAAARADECW